MSYITDERELTEQLLHKGIMPCKKNLPDINYMYVKKTLKSKLKYELVVVKINAIYNKFKEVLIDYLITNGDIDAINHKQAIEIILDNQSKLKKTMEAQITKALTDDDFQIIVQVIVNSSALFNEKNIRKILLISQIEWCSEKYSRIKHQLENIFNRGLVKEEYHLMVETWCYYFSLAKDLENSSEYLKEQINELKGDYNELIELSTKKIEHYQRIVGNLKSIERLTDIELSKYEQTLILEQEHCNSLKESSKKLNRDNKSELNIFNLKQKAYFSVFFLAELLGLKKPRLNKNGNPFIDIWIILNEISESEVDAIDIRNRAKSQYGHYTKLKESSTEIQSTIDKLTEKPMQISKLQSTLESFQAKILLLDINPVLTP